MIKIIFLPETLLYFNELATILYYNDYFGFEEDAMRYVDDLMYDIKTSYIKEYINLLRCISIVMEKGCITPHFLKARLPNGMCFSRNTMIAERWSF